VLALLGFGLALLLCSLRFGTRLLGSGVLRSLLDLGLVTLLALGEMAVDFGLAARLRRRNLRLHLGLVLLDLRIELALLPGQLGLMLRARLRDPLLMHLDRLLLRRGKLGLSGDQIRIGFGF
jgi:hypothetical protein